jgi:hypothetical protein
LIGEFDEYDALHGVVGYKPTLEFIDLHGNSDCLSGNAGNHRVVSAFNPKLQRLGA